MAKPQVKVQVKTEAPGERVAQAFANLERPGQSLDATQGQGSTQASPEKSEQPNPPPHEQGSATDLINQQPSGEPQVLRKFLKFQ